MKRVLIAALVVVGVLGAVGLMYIRSGFLRYVVPSGAMLETLQIGDTALINKSAYLFAQPIVGDIMMYRPPLHALSPHLLNPDGSPKASYLHRCVGGPGDVVEVRKGVLYRNGVKQAERYAPVEDEYNFKLVLDRGEYIPVHVSDGFINGPSATRFQVSPERGQALLKLPPAKIPADHYLLMGDNRSESFDGRFWGLIPRGAIEGRFEGVIPR